MKLVNYDLNKAAVAKMSDIYLKLTIDGIDDIDGAAEVHSAKMIVVKHRTAINKLRLSTNKDAQDFIKTNNKNAAVLIDLLAPIEDHLKTEEGKITKEKERIKAEEEAAEKIKISERVDVLFKVNMNIPYFDAAMLSDDEFFTMLDEATNKYNIERLRLQKEQKAKEEEEKRLADEKTAQEAEAKRLAAIQVAQEKKEAELKAQAKASEDAKKAETERKNREAFEKKAKEDAKAQSKKEAKEKAEKERREQREKTEKSRTKLLSAVDFSVDSHDLGTMPDDQFDRMYSKAKAKWDKKQAKLLTEKLEKERIEAEEKRIAKEKVDREAKEQEIKEARFESLKEIGFKYPFNDLGTMPEKQYCELYDSHRKVWDAEQQAIFIEKLKKERLEKEKAEADEKARAEVLLPDKDKLVKYAASILKLSAPDIKNKQAQEILEEAQDGLGLIASEIMKQMKEL